MWLMKKIHDIYMGYRQKQILDIDASLELTDIHALCYPRNNLPAADRIATNGAYGHAYHLKKFAGLDTEAFLNCTIEHGVNITGNYVCFHEVEFPISTMFVMSKARKYVVEDVTYVQAKPIGPYIAYADDYCTAEELKRIKSSNGKTLLIFPSHGWSEVEQSYDIKKFLNEIKKVAHNFDTVLVCLYYYDIWKKAYKAYKAQGYIVVSAGFESDIYFLSRQKMIIQLSDAVMGNAHTTGLGYSLFFDKPVYLYKQPIQLRTKLNNISQFTSFNQRIIDEWFDVCSDSQFQHLDEQKKWANYYFGFDEIKTKAEMSALLKPLIREK